MKREMRNQLLKLVKAVQPGTGAGVATPMKDVKFCIRCGKTISQQAKFCAECGHAQD